MQVEDFSNSSLRALFNLTAGEHVVIVFNSWKLGRISRGHHYVARETQLASVGNHNVVLVIRDVTIEHIFDLNISTSLQDSDQLKTLNKNKNYNKNSK